MSFIRVGFCPPCWTCSQRICRWILCPPAPWDPLFLWSLLLLSPWSLLLSPWSLLLFPSVLWLQLLRPDLLLCPDSVGFTRNMVKRQTTAGNLVPLRETSSPAGGYSRPTCRSSCCYSSRRVLQHHPPFSEEHPLQLWVPCWLRSLCLSVPGPRSSSDDWVCLLTAKWSPMVCSRVSHNHTFSLNLKHVQVFPIPWCSLSLNIPIKIFSVINYR